MTNNDVLKRIRYTFDYNDAKMIEIFELADKTVTREQICNWLKKEEDELYKEMFDRELAYFLNGFINENRGKKEGVQPIVEKRLTNNMILRKLKIALNIQSDEALELFASEGKNLSKHELSAFFRKPEQTKYKYLNDQYLRNFLQALQVKYKVN